MAADPPNLPRPAPKTSRERFDAWAAGLPDDLREAHLGASPPPAAGEYADFLAALPADLREAAAIPAVDPDLPAPVTPSPNREWHILCQEEGEWLARKSCRTFADAAEWFRRRMGHDTVAHLVRGDVIVLTREPDRRLVAPDGTGYRLGRSAVEFLSDAVNGDAGGLLAQADGFLGPPELAEVTAGGVEEGLVQGPASPEELEYGFEDPPQGQEHEDDDPFEEASV